MYKATLLILLAFLFLASTVFSETTGSINVSTQGNISPITGLFGNVAPNTCSSNSECFEYKCFIDFDGTSESGKSGWCNQTSITRCYHNGVTYDSGTYYCRTNTTHHLCDGGGWGNQTSCSSGQTCTVDSTSTNVPCSTPSTAASGGGGGGGGTSKHSIKLVSGIADFDILQGESIVKNARFKNDGNLTLTNITLALSGINENWYGTNPPKFLSINPGKEEQFNVTFFIPNDAGVKSYQISAEIKTHKSDTSAKFSFTIKVLPSNETVEKDVIPKYSRLVSLLQALEQNITALIPKGVDEGNITVLRNIAETIKSKLNQANASLERKDYFTANSLLSDAESLLNGLKAKIAEAKPPEVKIDILMLTLIAFAVIIILFVLYLLWPQKAVGKQ